MDFFEVIRSRRSIRRFEVRPVEEEKLSAILEAANAAPSAGNLQAYEIYVVSGSDVLVRLAGLMPQIGPAGEVRGRGTDAAGDGLGEHRCDHDQR